MAIHNVSPGPPRAAPMLQAQCHGVSASARVTAHIGILGPPDNTSPEMAPGQPTLANAVAVQNNDRHRTSPKSQIPFERPAGWPDSHASPRPAFSFHATDPMVLTELFSIIEVNVSPGSGALWDRTLGCETIDRWRRGPGAQATNRNRK